MKQIKATEAFGTPYMTQSAEVDIEQRLFVRAVSGINPTLSDWRGATVEEKAEWQEEMDKLNPIEASETNLTGYNYE